MQLFALAETKLHFESTVLQIDLKGNERIAHLADFLREMANLAFVQQKLFLAHGIGIEDVADLKEDLGQAFEKASEKHSDKWNDAITEDALA